MQKVVQRTVSFKATRDDLRRLARIQSLIQSTTTSETLRRAIAIAEAHLESKA